MTDKNYSQMELLERLMDTAKAVIPESLGKDVRDNLRVAVQEVLSDLDVVTREELDVQKAVLSKTRAKVDAMESIISDLEKQLNIQ